MKKSLLILTSVFIALNLNAQTNLLQNGDFSLADVDPMQGATGTEWGVWSDNNGTARIEEGVVIATPGGADAANNWKLQVEQKDFVLENGKTYKVSFKAHAEAARNIGVTIEDYASDRYSQFGKSTDKDTVAGGKSKWNIAITTEARVYERSFVCDNVLEDTKAKFSFLLSETTEVVYIDDVSLTEVAAATSVSSKKSAAAMVLFPNPAVSGSLVKVSGNAGLINVFDLSGKLVTSSETNSISGLAKGMYFVKSGNQIEKLIVK